MKLPLPIPAKSRKKVMEISKFFKQGTKPTENKKIRKLYAQALSIKTSKILRIKKTFPKLLANKINNIYKIVNRGNKLKQKINIMTKVLSRKQVIIPMSNDVICRSTGLENYIPTVMSPLKNTSLPSTAATFLTTCLMVVLQPSGYSVFHDGVAPVSVSTLKPPLGAIGVLPLKPQVSPIISVCI